MATILHVIDTTGPGGAETVFVELADRLRGHGHRSLALLRGAGWVAETLSRRGIEPWVLDSKGSLHWRYAARLCRLIRRERVDLVQSHLLGSNVYCAVAGWLTGVPVVATFHGTVDIAERERLRVAKKWLMQRAVYRYVTVSRSLAQEVAAGGLIDPARTCVIANGVDPAAFAVRRRRDLAARLQLPAGATLVGCLGNVRPAKGYDLLIRAAREVCARHRHVHFVVAGEIHEPTMAPLRAQRAAAGLERRVHFLGFEPDRAAFLANLDLFVLPSRSEGFSIATLEAQAAGVAVVATRCGGPEEILEPDVTGLLVPPAQPAALAAAIGRLLTDARLRQRLSRDGFAALTQRFSLARMVQRYHELYGEALYGQALSPESFA